MQSLTPAEQAYWNKYLSSLPLEQRPIDSIVLAGLAGNAEITDHLLALYLTGRKCAGSSLLEDFLAAGDPLPQVGNHWILLNSRGEPSCLLRTERVVRHKFKDVPEEVAVAEGEGDLTLEAWKRIHSEIYSPFLMDWGVDDLNEATVITEFFRIVFR